MKKLTGDPAGRARGARHRACIPAFLRAFHEQHENEWPSCTDVAKLLKVDRSVAWYHLNQLREEGKVKMLRYGWMAT